MAWFRSVAVANSSGNWAASFLLCSFLGIVQASSALASPYEEAVDAMGRGDYARALELLAPLARQGDASAQARLGDLYACGCGVSKDDRRAFDLFRKSADQGSPLGQVRLGTAYERGEGIARNTRKAIELYRLAAGTGSVDGEARLCATYMGSSGGGAADAEAAKWCKLAADAGDARSQYHLALCYEGGRGVAKDEEQAFEWLKRSAESGLPQAQYKLANFLMLEEGPRWNGSQGMLWAAAAAGKGLSDAGVLVGLGHQYGVGVPKNPQRALQWAQEAVVSGNPSGLMMLGGLAAAGVSESGIPASEMSYVAYALATKLVPDEGRRQSARKSLGEIRKRMTEQEVRSAERRLADALRGSHSDFSGKRHNACAVVDVLIETEQGNVRDDCVRLVALGIPVGLYNMAWMTLHGEKVDPDAAKGMALLQRAAADDFPAAELDLGKQYASGEFVTQDLRQSLGWLLVAMDRLATAQLTANYAEDAARTADEVRKQLSLPEVAQALRWARDWISTHAWSDAPFEQCNYVQLDDSRMAALFDAVYQSAAQNNTADIYTNARTIGGPCTFDYYVDYAGNAHLSFSFVVKPPENGSLERFRDVGFQYWPAVGFRGIDKFVINLCGAQDGKPETCFQTTAAVEVRCVGKKECGNSSEPEKPDRKF